MKKTNKNNKIILFSLVGITILAFSAILSAINASDVEAASGFPYSEDLHIALLNQDPAPVEPGKYVDIRFSVENYGTTDAENVTFVLLPEYPFYLDDGDNAEKSLGKINGGQIGRDSVYIKYRLRVDKNAIDGPTALKIKYRTSNLKTFIELDDFEVDVKTKNVRLLIEDIKVLPERISPGETADIKITIKNVFASPINNIRLKLQPSATYFSILGSDEKIITSLGANEETDITFKVISNGDAKSEVHQFSLTADFSDTLGANYSKTNTVSVIVDEKPSYMINIDDTKVFSKNQKGKVTISVSNTGLSEMRYAVLELMPSDDYEILSSPKSYLGILKSDDFQTAEFTIYTKTNKAFIPLLVKLSYKDNYNQLIDEQIVLNMKMYSATDAKKYGFIASNGKFNWILAVIVLSVIGFFAYRKFRHQSKKFKKEIIKQ
ncbi:MAG: COG1361 S-layer family protein [Nanoarchaeota archaeon]|nr:COG1361 S-layer family protein [Nanoarchaeota archaeon]